MRPFVVARGQLATLRNGRAAFDDIAGAKSYFSWESGHLSFDRQPLREVLASISRWYDLDIAAVQPELLERRVTADFSTQSPTAMIEALAAAVGASAVRDGRRVTLSLAAR
jgi:ferric-dicitrate binding protein FerR (iron transport regulator)